MKIYFNRAPVDGPYGGGNKSLKAIYEECLKRGYQVTLDHQAVDVDRIFCMDPRPNQYGASYDHLMDLREKTGAKILQRVGDVGTHNKPELTQLLNQVIMISDCVVFPSFWARDQLNDAPNTVVILNKPVADFYQCRAVRGDHRSTFTHHWSNNPMKGFEVYSQIDSILSQNDFKFTFMGRHPDNFRVKNRVPAADISEIIKEMGKHGIYITASQKEAGANHVLEAMAAGLPVLYHVDGGSIVDYCHSFGKAYQTVDQLFDGIKEIAADIELWRQKTREFSGTIQDVASEYVDLLESM